MVLCPNWGDRYLRRIANASAPVKDTSVTHVRLCCLLFFLMASATWADESLDLVNYRTYSPTLSSSGQPSAKQLAAVADAGFERVVYLALTDQDSSLEHEDRIVRELGMGFAQIPVIWERPTAEDFELFAAVMRQGADKRTLVHCQINWRASSFVFLYRTIYGGVPMSDAKLDLDQVWTPQPHWKDFIFEVLASHNLSPDCELCDWDKPHAMNH